MVVETPAITFHTLYQRYSPEVYRYALSLSGDLADAKDITAETFARCWSDFGRVRMPTVKAYLFTIARNLYLHTRRGRQRHAGLDPNIEDRANLVELVEQKSEIEAVWRWLEELSPVDREVFILRVVYELSYVEIAHIHGLTESAAKVKVHRARLKLIRRRAQQENP